MGGKSVRPPNHMLTTLIGERERERRGEKRGEERRGVSKEFERKETLKMREGEKERQ